MFDIGWIEMAVIAVVVIIFIAPKDLPGVIHAMGRWVGKARAMARELQESLDDMVKESGLDEVKKEIESATHYDIEGEIEKTIDPGGELKQALDSSQPPADESRSKPKPGGKAAPGTAAQAEDRDASAVQTPVTEDQGAPAKDGT